MGNPQCQASTRNSFTPKNKLTAHPFNDVKLYTRKFYFSSLQSINCIDTCAKVMSLNPRLSTFLPWTSSLFNANIKTCLYCLLHKNESCDSKTQDIKTPTKQVQRHTTVIPATQEAEAGRSQVASQSRQMSKMLSQNKIWKGFVRHRGSIPVISTWEAETGGLFEFELSLGYIVSSRTAWSTLLRPYLKKEGKETWREGWCWHIAKG